MSKKRRTVSLEPEVDEYLSRPEVNASALVNELVSQHQNGGVNDDAVLRMREEQVESEVEHLKTRAEKKQEELDAIRDKREEKAETRSVELSEAFDVLESLNNRDKLEPTNAAVKTQAGKVGMTPEELINEYKR